MSDGKCGVREYKNIGERKIGQIITELKNHGNTVTGDNPWDVDVGQHGVKLQGTWDEASSALRIIVTAKNWYVPCGKIWEQIDPLMQHVEGTEESELASVST